MELTLREFENLNLYSHKNMERVIRKLVNESYNAALTSMFDDSLVLLDHTEGKFYVADYSFNEKDLTLSLSEFEEVKLVKEEEDFEEAVEDFFEGEDLSPHDLARSYKENIVEQERYIDELIAEVVSTKDFSASINYKKIKEAKEGLVLESTKEPFFKLYEERLETHPLTKIKYFDWKTPVKVSLMETEKYSVINTTVVEKAKSMWKRDDFKEAFLEAAEELQEGEYEKMLALFESFPVLFHLAEEDRLAVFGKSLLSSSLREDRKYIVEKIEELINEDYDFICLRESYIAEDEDEDDVAGIDQEDTPKVPKEEKKLELTPAETEKLKKDLQALCDKMEDGEEKEKLSDIIEKISASKEEGTKPADIKEAVSLLTI